MIMVKSTLLEIVCQNHITLQLKLKKQLICNYCATIPWHYNYYATILLKIQEIN
jgi:hypothetical protein